MGVNTLDSVVRSKLLEVDSKEAPSTYSDGSQSRTCFARTSRANGISGSVLNRVGQFPRGVARADAVKKAPPSSELKSNSEFRRCLASLPDLGNPFILVGWCWWQDYGPLLAKVGLLGHVRKAKCTHRMSSGDGPSVPSICILLQVPLWYRCSDGFSILVFANIRLVPNVVGLLDGKNNFAALEMAVRLGHKKATRFICCGKRLDHVDDGSHYILKLNNSRRFYEDEHGLAVCRDSKDGPLEAHRVLARQHHRNCTVAIAPEYGSTYTDKFAELRQEFKPDAQVSFLSANLRNPTDVETIPCIENTGFSLW
jgi:hypothetical protein